MINDKERIHALRLDRGPLQRSGRSAQRRGKNFSHSGRVGVAHLSGTGAKRSSQIARHVPRSCTKPSGRAKKKICKCAPPSPHRETCARAMCSSDSIARAVWITMSPSCAASSAGRSVTSKCSLGISTNTSGAPEGLGSTSRRHVSSCQMTWSSPLRQFPQVAGSSPFRAGSGRSGACRGATRRPSCSKGKMSQRVIPECPARPSPSAVVRALSKNSSGVSGIEAWYRQRPFGALGRRLGCHPPLVQLMSVVFPFRSFRASRRG